MNAQDCVAALHQLADGLLAEKPFALLGVDGRCGSGKTTLAAGLAQSLAASPIQTANAPRCQIIHMDDFYLPLSARRADWASTPTANMNFFRLQTELLLPLRAGLPGLYKPYTCRTGSYGEAGMVAPTGLIVVEGSYALHGMLRGLYDARVFVTCDAATQQRRLQAREGARYDHFTARWIPLEEGYFTAETPQTCCELVLDTSES